jgi:DNA-binding protein H-NS
MQRRLESSVRNEKTTRELARASGDNALVKRCNERIKAYQGEYNDISEITGIQGDKKRMSVSRSTASVKGATPTPKKVAENPKVEVKKILSQEETIQKAKDLAKSPDYEKASSLQQVRAITNKKLGYDELPKVVGREEFEKLAQRKAKMYRGVQSSDTKTASEIVDEFKYGELWTGNNGGAVYGNGVYFTATESIASGEYAGQGGKIIEAILTEDAKVADFEELSKEYFDTGLPKIIGLPKENYQLIIRDVGQYAATKGYDAIALNGYQGKDYTVLLNRAKCIVKG